MKDKKMKEKCKQQSNSESESDREILMLIFKYFRLDKYYLPDNKFQYTFIDKTVDSAKRKELEKKLENCLEKIRREFETLTGKKS